MLIVFEVIMLQCLNEMPEVDEYDWTIIRIISHEFIYMKNL